MAGSAVPGVNQKPMVKAYQVSGGIKRCGGREDGAGGDVEEGKSKASDAQRGQKEVKNPSKVGKRRILLVSHDK
jgi:hypothetical protein